MKNLNDDFKEISGLLIKASKHPKMIFTAMCVFVFVCCFLSKCVEVCPSLFKAGYSNDVMFFYLALCT